MKSAYELAMERLEKDNPSGPVLSEEKKKEIAEINEKCEAQIAQAKIMADQQLMASQGDPQIIQEIQANLANEILRLEEERDHKKQKVRDELE